jgi:hypothetical protein
VAVGKREGQLFGFGTPADEDLAVVIEVRHRTSPCR